tara:strand:+ start:558 stop:2297 length:1740 start_codon:yes stop_codon:yes gene_type:complete
MKFLLIIMFFCSLQASTVRVMTYNVLNFSDENDREDDFIDIIEYIDPDIIIVQELIGQTGYLKFKTDVLDIIEPDSWSGAPFTNQTAQQDIALYYKNNIFDIIGTNVIYSAQSSGTRDVIEWSLEHGQSGVSFNVYGVHLKASSGNSNAQERLEEATILREYLNGFQEGTYFIVGGDFNIYSNNPSSEPAFEMLTGTSEDNDGQLFDPINRIGHWHNNSSYADVHTQSPRTSSFGGGATGGMDDRFDWLFVSQRLLDQSSSMYYVDNTYWAFGNDGNHFNDAINDGNNSSISNELANSLHDASDHLPVYMDVWFDDLSYSDLGVVITEVMVNPASVSDSYGEWFEIINTTDSIIDINGWQVKDSGVDEFTIYSNVGTLPIYPGDYFVFARNGDYLFNGGVIADYDYDNFSLSNLEDQLILMDTSGSIVDEVYYSDIWPFSNGVSMEIHDPLINNLIYYNWYESVLIYGDGDFGSPGLPYDASLDNKEQNINPGFYDMISLYPNPFNNEITITIKIKNDSKILIEVFDISGHIITILEEGLIYKGEYEYRWNAGEVSTGIYFFRLSYDSNQIIKKAILLK